MNTKNTGTPTKDKAEVEETVETEVDETTVSEAAGDEVEIPEDLTTLSDEDIAALHDAMKARGGELAAKAKKGELDDDEKAEASVLGEDFANVVADVARRTTEKAEAAAKLSSALSAFATAEPEEDEVEETETAEVEEPTETDEVEVDDTSTSEAAVDSGKDGTVTTEVAKPSKKFRNASPAALRNQSRASKPKAPGKEEGAFSMEATAFAHVPESTEFTSTKEVAEALWRKRMSFGNIPQGVSEQLYIVTGSKEFDTETPMVGMDPQTNLVALRDIQQALVASGEFCTPQNQLYNFFRLAQPIRDVEDAIPTVQAPRGGIRFIQANCTIQGAGAIGSYTYDPATPGGPDSEDEDFEKPCDRVSCPDIGETFVEAVTKCVIFDNLQYRTFPELVEDFMEDVAIQFTMKKQKYYLDKIDAASTLTVGIGSYGAARSLVYDLTVAANGYRKRHHMPRNAALDVLIPDWAVDVLKADLFNDGDNGLDYLNVPDSAIATALRNRNLNVTWYYEDVTGDGYVNTLALPQAGNRAPLNDYPAVVSSFMFAPGTFVKLDGGTLDVGLYRDHSLNKKNDFAMFMEEWLGFAMLGCESVRIDSTVCPSGSRAPYAASLRTCPEPVTS